MKIEYPTPEEQNAAVSSILKHGLQRRPLFAELRDMRRSLGLRVIFQNQGDVLFVSALAVFCTAYGLLCSTGSIAEHGKLYGVLFAASPTLYILLCLLGFWKEKLSTAYDLKRTCKYTVCHLTVFRMLTFSCANIVVNLATAGVCCLVGVGEDFWRMFMVSASGLFLLSVLLLYSLLPGGLLAPTLVAAAWIPGNVLCDTFCGEAYGRFLREVPLPLHCVVTVVLACLYVSGLKQLLLRKKEKILC